MPLTVLSVSYPLAPVAANTAGGAEQVLAMLDHALVHAGHKSLVIAQEGSRCRGTLLPIPAPGPQLDTDAQQRAWQQCQAAIHCALEQFPINVVHLHGVDFTHYLPEPGVPVVVTLHLPPSWYPKQAFELSRPDTYLVCVSDSQAWACAPSAKISRVIRNGIRVDEYHPAREKGHYALALGRICPEKGFEIALDAAAECGIPLVLAGTVFGYASHQEYFAKVIEPRLVGRNRFVGAVGPKAKEQLLAGARCLVVPSLVDETSSLVAMEAMACGTPVVAFRRGALIELVEDGRTGFLVDTAAQMARALEAAGRLSSTLCREYAAKHFSANRMIDEYLELYRTLAARKKISEFSTEKVA